MDYHDTAQHELSGGEGAPRDDAGGGSPEGAGTDPQACPEDSGEPVEYVDDEWEYYHKAGYLVRRPRRLPVVEEPGPGDDAPLAARPAYPSGFGRGWIPLGRDIGIPGEDCGPPQLPAQLPAQLPPQLPAAPAQAGGDPGSPRHTGPGSEHDVVAGPLRVGARPAVHLEPAEGQGPERQGRAEVLPGRWWTPERKVRFLDDLAGHGNVRLACARVRISPEAAYRLRRRDFVFAEAWTAALVLARVQAEQVLADRALHGVEEAVWHRGELVGTRRRFDNRLLLAHLGRLDRLAEEPRAQERAGRFDELLALVAGESFPEDMADSRDGPRYEPDPLLPMERERYIAEAGERAGEEARAVAREAIAAEHDIALDAYLPERAFSPEQCEALDEIEWEANLRGREAGEAAYDDWLGRAEASGDLAAGEGSGGEDSGGGGFGGEDVGARDSREDEPRRAVTSLDAAEAPSADRPLRQPWRAAGAVLRGAQGGQNGARRSGAAFSPRTLSTPSTPPDTRRSGPLRSGEAGPDGSRV